MSLPMRSGYQFLLDFKGWRGSFPSVTLAELLSGNIAPEVLRDKIVLVGVTAESVKDHFYTPFSRGLQENQQTDGVAIHAHIASQLIRLGLGGAAPIKTINEWQEGIWIMLWSAIGALTGFKVRSPWKFSFALGSGLLALAVFDFSVFLEGWWLPLVPPALAWFDRRSRHHCIPIVSGDGRAGRLDAVILAARLKTGG